MKRPKTRDGNTRPKAYAGCGDAGAPVCIRFYGDVGQGSAEQWTQQLPQTLNLWKEHTCMNEFVLIWRYALWKDTHKIRSQHMVKWEVRFSLECCTTPNAFSDVYHLATVLTETFNVIPWSSSSACSLGSVQTWSRPHSAACSHGSRPRGAPCVAAAGEGRRRWNCGTIPGESRGRDHMYCFVGELEFIFCMKHDLTLNKQNLRGLNLSFPLRSSRERNSMNWLMNTGSEKWSKMICSRC